MSSNRDNDIIIDQGASVVNSAFDATNDVISNVQNATIEAKNYMNDLIVNSSTVLYGLIFLLIISLFVGYGLYMLIIDNVLYQQKILINETEVPILCNQLTEVKVNQYLTQTNGKRGTFSFWIYINDINKYSNAEYKHILHFGESFNKINGSSPYVFLDNVSNKIHVRFSPTNDVISNTLTLSSVTSQNDLLKYNNNSKYCGFTIEYVPIQRWVHIAFVITDNNGGSIYLYVDGELIEVKENKANYPLNIADLKLYNKNNLYIGGNIYNTDSLGFSGLISRVALFNYDLNQNDIYKEYNKGPFSSILTSIGIGSYGIRNPIYKLNNY